MNLHTFARAGRWPVLPASALLAGAVLAAAAEDPAALFKQLSITRDDAQDMVLDTLGDGHLRLPAALKAIPASQRAAAVRTAAQFVGTVVRSDACAKWYAEYRATQRPELPEEAMLAAELRALRIAEAKKAIAQAERECSAAAAEVKQACQQALPAMRKSLADAEKVDAAADAAHDAAVATEHAEARRAHAQKVAEWEVALPAGNPKALVDRRVKAWLAATQDVDYAAAVVKDKQGKLRFKKAEYEGKPQQWKLAFRAGKEATTAARIAAEALVTVTPARAN